MQAFADAFLRLLPDVDPAVVSAAAALLQTAAALATFAITWRLVRITKKYSDDSRWMVEHYDRAAQPQLIGRAEPLGSKHAVYSITNVGGSSALDVELILDGKDRGQQAWRHQVFEPGRTESFVLPGLTQSLEKMAEDGVVIRAVLTWTDSRGHRSRAEHEISGPTLWNNWKDAKWRRHTNELKDEVQRLTLAVAGVRDNLKNLK